MNIQKGYTLVPVVATLEMKNAGWRECDRQGIEPESIEMQTIWTAMQLAAPAPPQPIYDEDVVAWEVTGGGVKPGVFTFKPGWAVDDPAYTVRELVYAQSRAKAGEDAGDPAGSFDKHMEYMRRCVDLEKERDTLQAKLSERDELLEYVDRQLTNLQPHIEQCYAGRAEFIDNYVDPVILKVRAALSTEKPDESP